MISIDDELYSERVLVFIEIEPQSNKYRQCILPPERFKKMTSTLGKIIKNKDGSETIETIESDDIYILPDLEQIYETKNH